MKTSLGLLHVAPEILFNGIFRITLDPEARWLLTSLRLFLEMRSFDLHIAYQCLEASPEFSRLGAFRAFLGRLGWTLQPHYLNFGDSHTALDQNWMQVRIAATAAFRRNRYGRLVERRPRVYGGLTDTDNKQARLLLKSLSSFRAMVLVRMWGGAAMTASHKHTLDPSHPQGCSCGAEIQDVAHLVFYCPNFPPPR